VQIAVYRKCRAKLFGVWATANHGVGQKVRRRRLVKSKVISLKFVSESDEPVGYLMVETDDEAFAKQTAFQVGR
jgi:hypothetical protein